MNNQREERLSLSDSRDMMYENFRTNIWLLRTFKGMSCVELANELHNKFRLTGNLRGKRLIDIEYGRANPTIDEVNAFAKYFGISISDIFEKERKLSFVSNDQSTAYVLMNIEKYKPSTN